MIGRFKLYLKRKKHEKLHAKSRKSNPKAYAFIDKVIEEFHSGGGLKHNYQAYKLYCLRNILWEVKPKKILELGTGTTSVVLADYCNTNDCSLTSVDENEKWLKHTKTLIEKITGYKGVNYIFSKRKHRVEGEKLFFSYEIAIDQNDYDLILVDGPSMRLNGVRRKDGICEDTIQLIKKTKSKVTILIDIREATVSHIKEVFGSRVSKLVISDLITNKADDENYLYFSRIDI